MSDQQDIVKQLVQALDLDELTDGYRNRLLILDSQIEQFHKGLQQLGNIIAQLQAVCKVCGRLNLLAGNISNQAPPADREEDKGTIENLTDWY